MSAQSIFGVPIVVTKDIPKMQLSEDCPVTPEFRIEINAWMVEFFGVYSTFEDGKIWKSEGKLFMNPRTYATLKQNGLFNEMKNYGNPKWIAYDGKF
jgi:hypothetical protein